MIGAAAAAHDRKLRQQLAQRAVLRAELAGIAGIELGRFVELRMALGRSIGAQTANPLAPASWVARALAELCGGTV